MRFLTSPLLTEARFAHAFSTRDIDLALTAANRAESLARLAREAGLGEIVREANQVHGARVVDAADLEGAASWPDADALVAARGAAAVGVRVADCVPILVGDRATGRVAAIHAGWRGLVGGVIQAAIARLEARDAVAAIGPCIGPCCFEVGRDVAAQIVAAAGPVIDREVETKAFVDLRRAARLVLTRENVASIDDVARCTFCSAGEFFSFRRGGDPAGSRPGEPAIEKGRMIGAIRPYCD